MWMQELLWVRRDERGQIVGIREKPPENEDIVPIAPRPGKGTAKEKSTAATVDQ